VYTWVLTTAATIARFTALADKHGLVFGELLALALDAFEARNRERQGARAQAPPSTFWFVHGNESGEAAGCRSIRYAQVN
jgi:hypothetical protein